VYTIDMKKGAVSKGPAKPKADVSVATQAMDWDIDVPTSIITTSDEVFQVRNLS
jgi:hypothetical protein